MSRRRSESSTVPSPGTQRSRRGTDRPMSGRMQGYSVPWDAGKRLVSCTRRCGGATRATCKRRAGPARPRRPWAIAAGRCGSPRCWQLGHGHTDSASRPTVAPVSRPRSGTGSVPWHCCARRLPKAGCTRCTPTGPRQGCGVTRRSSSCSGPGVSLSLGRSSVRRSGAETRPATSRRPGTRANAIRTPCQRGRRPARRRPAKPWRRRLWSLLEESGERGAEIRRRATHGVDVGGEAEALGERYSLQPVELLFGEGEGAGADRGQRAQQVRGLLLEIGVLVDAGDEPDGGRFGRGEEVAGRGEVERDLLAHTALQQVHHQRRHEAALHLRVPELRRLGGEHQVARGGEPAPARERAPAHQRDRSEEHTSELQSHGLISYAVFCLKKKKQIIGDIVDLQYKRSYGDFLRCAFS